MADAISTMRDGNDVDAFTDVSDAILDSNQTVIEPTDRHKLMTTALDATLASRGFRNRLRMGFRNFAQRDAHKCGMDGSPCVTVF